jgi:hypothetical protein
MQGITAFQAMHHSARVQNQGLLDVRKLTIQSWNECILLKQMAVKRSATALGITRW